MAIPLAGWALATVIISLAGAGGFAVYQIRASVESVEEVFVSPTSALNNIFLQAIVGAVVGYFLFKKVR